MTKIWKEYITSVAPTDGSREMREAVGAEIIDSRVNRKREEMYRRWLVESGQCRYIKTRKYKDWYFL